MALRASFAQVHFFPGLTTVNIYSTYLGLGVVIGEYMHYLIKLPPQCYELNTIIISFPDEETEA